MIRKIFAALFSFIAVSGFAENPAPIYGQRASLFELLIPDSNSIVMLGNSLTNGCEWHELFGNPKVINRGIVGDTTDDIDERLAPVIKGHPAKIFLMTGTNDISHDLSADTVAAKIMAIVGRIRTESPSTEVYVQSLLPINNSFGKYKRMIGKEDVIRQVNVILKNECAKEGIPYIDIHSLLTDDEGNLRKDLTNDGLHILGPAYMIWKQALLPYIEE